MANNNFLVWDPAGTNMETDSAYSADSLRSSGAAPTDLFPSITANKAFYQWSTFIAAFAQMLQNKQYSVMDSNLNTLAGVLANIMTQADMTPFALLASPAFSGNPTAPTPPSGDSSTRVATTNFVSTLALPGLNRSVPGTMPLPGGMLIKWANSNSINGWGGVTAVWDSPFPHACLFVQATPVVTAVQVSGDLRGLSFIVQPGSNQSQVGLFANPSTYGSETYYAAVLGIGY